MNEAGNSQISSVIINDKQNRLISEGQSVQEFKITNMPQNVNLDETLSISGQAQPTSAVMVSIKNQDVLETVQVVNVGVNGEWNFERAISSDDSLGERTIICLLYTSDAADE